MLILYLNSKKEEVPKVFLIPNWLHIHWVQWEQLLNGHKKLVFFHSHRSLQGFSISPWVIPETALLTINFP